MGNPIPDEWPELGECPGCCGDLPDSLPGRIVEPPNTFTGTIDRDEGDPCVFVGYLTNGNGGRPLYAAFCSNDGTDLVLHTLAPPYGCTIEGNHCHTPASCTFMEDMVFQVG